MKRHTIEVRSSMIYERCKGKPRMDAYLVATPSGLLVLSSTRATLQPKGQYLGQHARFFVQ